ncbi:MAG TPA: ABC transporter substrate-binding protein, partial [Candidatus Acidoferrum sp.]|nr:ABC transporter substrate-binding protein [Candidatus Acidoferrum sp.]
MGLVLSILAVSVAADAQSSGKVYRIGVLTNAPPTDPGIGRLWEAFAAELRERGYIEGRDFVIERRWTEGQVERVPALAAELVRLKVDLILAVGNANVVGAKQASGAIPIVMVYVSDPAGYGIVDSLAHPGGNVTGVTFVAGPEIVGKHLELLKEVVPRVSRVAVLSNPASALYAGYLRETRAAGRVLRVTLQFYEARDPNELKGAFTAMTKARAGALLVLPHPFTFANAKRIADLATESRLPAVYAFRESVEAGGLMAYAANAPDMFRRAATYVDKIFHGAKPGDLPVEQP